MCRRAHTRAPMQTQYSPQFIKSGRVQVLQLLWKSSSWRGQHALPRAASAAIDPIGRSLLLLRPPLQLRSRGPELEQLRPKAASLHPLLPTSSSEAAGLLLPPPSPAEPEQRGNQRRQSASATRKLQRRHFSNNDRQRRSAEISIKADNRKGRVTTNQQ